MENKDKQFIFLPHTADVKFQAFGVSLEKCFEHAAKAMFAVMDQGKLKGKGIKKGVIEVRGRDLSALLYNFLEELIFLMDTQDFFLDNVNVDIEKKEERKTHYHLTARIFGRKASQQEISIVVKAVTYNQMFIKEEQGQWIAQVVLDV